ncbi:acyltransferase [Photobacterium sp. WH24]|uniref:acyltransferase family protein n=1 Tax=Photobacterium sp. WH24 TaxID=2827237 RepID=UPI001C44D724|nr:acyltransferase [Photobacterium sp. WH24]MBV7260600.1 acyltransferase [Photobacterium sp. WH24]
MANNNFDFLRIALAVTVFYMHMGILADIDLLSYLPGEFSVKCFFVISGYLIVKSFIRNPEIFSYYRSRFFRIYPLYFIVVSVCFVFGYLNYSQSFEAYMNGGAEKYLLSNYIFANFLASTLPGLFENNAMAVVNGSLWTIKVEVMFYISVPIIYGYLNKYLQERILTCVIAVFSLLSYYVIGHLVETYGLNASLNNQLPSLMLFFMVGAFFNFYNFSFLNKSHLLFIIPLLFLMDDFYLLYSLLVGSFVYIVAFVIKPIVIRKEIGDISYGIYLWHFPVIQVVIMYGLFDNLYVGFAIASISVFSLSLFSWHFIESKLIKKSKKHVMQTDVLN